MSTPDILLRGRDITRRWGGLTAVDRVSIDLRLLLGERAGRLGLDVVDHQRLRVVQEIGSERQPHAARADESRLHSCHSPSVVVAWSR